MSTNHDSNEQLVTSFSASDESRQTITAKEFHRNLQQFMADKEAYSEKTWRQMLHAISQWARWCETNNYPVMPLTTERLREYIQYLSQRGLAINSVKQHVAMLAMLQRQSGLIPVNYDPLIGRAMKVVRRRAIQAGERIGQAIPFRLPHLKAVINVWSKSNSLIELRNLAFLIISYHTLLRMSEAARLKIKDFEIQSDGRSTLFVGRTKTDISGTGELKGLGIQATKIIMHWLHVSGLEHQPDAYIFCRVHRTNKIILNNHPLTDKVLESIYQSAWYATQQTASGNANKSRYTSWSGHSARVGAAQDMADRGVSLAIIMREGGWKKAETVMGYIRKNTALSGAMLDVLE